MNNKHDAETTHFGYERVATGEKAQRVRTVFDSVAPNYDLMNDLMSLGAHRLWKRFALAKTGLRPGQRALDVAGGTGDLVASLVRQVGPTGQVFLTDINAEMLARGRDRLMDRGCQVALSVVQADAENLPFCSESFHCITIAFGLRNVTNKRRALASMAQLIKPGGRILILEFSQPTLKFLRPVYDAYSFNVLPVIGKLVTGNSASYRYLAESIRMHPDQGAMLSMLKSAGLEGGHYYNLSGGIVALHVAYKY